MINGMDVKKLLVFRQENNMENRVFSISLPIRRSSVKRWTVYHSYDTPCVDGVINGVLYITKII